MRQGLEEIIQVILTGNNSSSYPLLQQYVDNTGDVQSAALLLAQWE